MILHLSFFSLIVIVYILNVYSSSIHPIELNSIQLSEDIDILYDKLVSLLELKEVEESKCDRIYKQCSDKCKESSTSCMMGIVFDSNPNDKGEKVEEIEEEEEEDNIIDEDNIIEEDNIEEDNHIINEGNEEEITKEVIKQTIDKIFSNQDAKVIIIYHFNYIIYYNL